MDSLSANEAKTHFGELLIKAQRAPVHINRNGKPIAVVLSAEDYESIETLKSRLLQLRTEQAKADIESGEVVDGESFLDALEAGNHD